jgi:hypothetical protein
MTEASGFRYQVSAAIGIGEWNVGALGEEVSRFSGS